MKGMNERKIMKTQKGERIMKTQEGRTFDETERAMQAQEGNEMAEMKTKRDGNKRRETTKMKSMKSVIIMVVGVMLSCGAQYSFAATEGNAAVGAASSVTLAASQTDFTVPVQVEYAKAFAGVELAVQCGEGVTIKSVEYSKSISKAGPTEARGLVWFAAFSGGNDFEKPLTATVHAHYKGEGSTSMVIDHASFHRIDGQTFRTENIPLRKTVTIIREGASEPPPPPLAPPVTGTPSDTPGMPGEGNPSPGESVNSDSPGKETTKTPGSGNPGGKSAGGNPNGGSVSGDSPGAGNGSQGGGSPAAESAGGNSGSQSPVAESAGGNSGSQSPAAESAGGNDADGKGTDNKNSGSKNPNDKNQNNKSGTKNNNKAGAGSPAKNGASVPDTSGADAPSKSGTGVPAAGGAGGLTPIVANIPPTGGADAPSQSGAGELTPIVASIPPTGAESQLNEQTTSGEVGNEMVPIPSSEVPLAGGNAATTGPGDSSDALGMATFIMALSCLAALIFLTFLFMKRKKDEDSWRKKSNE
jgi:hypothetical protein